MNKLLSFDWQVWELKIGRVGKFRSSLGNSTQKEFRIVARARVAAWLGRVSSWWLARAVREHYEFQGLLVFFLHLLRSGVLTLYYENDRMNEHSSLNFWNWLIKYSMAQGRRVEGTGNSASVTPAQRFSTAVDKIYNARGACGEPRAISCSFHSTSLGSTTTQF